LIDLTHRIEEGMPAYPGTKPPRIISANTISTDGFCELELTFPTHTGTHIDTPAHIMSLGKSITDFDIDKFCGRAIVIPLSKANPLTVESLSNYSEILASVDFVLLNTAWDSNWGQRIYYKDFPLPSQEVFQQLTTYNLKGVGIDAISVDSVDSTKLPNHHTLLSNNLIIIENLTKLSKLGSSICEFFCFPLKIINGDGSPVRAVARLID
jgi:kynurenine formamidase